PDGVLHVCNRLILDRYILHRRHISTCGSFVSNADEATSTNAWHYSSSPSSSSSSSTVVVVLPAVCGGVLTGEGVGAGSSSSSGSVRVSASSLASSLTGRTVTPSGRASLQASKEAPG